MGESWVRVESEDELRAGTTVRLKRCGFCTRTHVFMLLRLVHGIALTDRPDGTRSVTDRGWTAVPTACPRKDPGGSAELNASSAVREGRLYKLVLDEPAAETTEREREREDCK